MGRKWDYRLLSSVCEDITSGGAAPQGEKYFSNGKYPFVRVVDMGNLQGKKTMSKTRDMVNDEGAANLRLFPRGTILFTKSGASLLLNQRAILNEPMFVVSHIGCLIPNKSVLPEWLYYWMKTIDFNIYAHATTLPSLKLSTIKDLQIPLPSLSEQEQIVARIEELFSQLDAGVETLKKAKAQLAVYRQAVLKEAFEGDNPKKQLKDFSKAISGYAFKSSKYSPDGDYIVVKIGNVKERRFDFLRDLTKTLEADDLILEKYLLQRGDCLITLTGSRGKRDYGFVAMIGDQNNYLLNQRVAALRFDQSVALPEYFQYYLASPVYRDMFFGYETGNVGQGNVGIKALLEPYVPLPDLDTQKRIVEDVESRLSVCDSIEHTVDTALQQAEAMRKSILKKAFEGGI